MGELISFSQAKSNLEYNMLTAQLSRHEGNVAKVARSLDINRNTVYSWIAKHNINVGDYKRG